MRRNKTSKKYIGKWVLINKDNKIIFSSNNVADVVNKGKEFPYNDVSIEKKLEPGTCFFWYLWQIQIF